MSKTRSRVMMRVETASTKMKQRVWKQKLMLAAKIRRQKGSLANMIYMEQLEMGWPGLSREGEEIGEACGVTDVNKREVTKEEIEEAVFYSSYKETKDEMSKYDKLKTIKDEDLRHEQEYMKEKSMETARLAFRIRSKMVKEIKMNFKNMHKNDLLCKECDLKEEESQEHVMVCPGWRDERAALDLSTTMGMVEFIKRITRRKMK